MNRSTKTHSVEPGKRLVVVGLGDSTTAGTPGFLSPVEYPPIGFGNEKSQYAHWMMQAHPEWEVLNRGVNGERSDQILRRWRGTANKEKPNYVRALAGVNDVYQGYPQEFTKRKLRQLYDAIMKDGVGLVTSSILPCDTMTPSGSRTIKELNGWIVSVSLERSVPFCDTNKAVADPSDPNRLLDTPDGLHPLPEGYQRMGEALVKVIEEDMNRRTWNGAASGMRSVSAARSGFEIEGSHL